MYNLNRASAGQQNYKVWQQIRHFTENFTEREKKKTTKLNPKEVNLIPNRLNSRHKEKRTKR